MAEAALAGAGLTVAPGGRRDRRRAAGRARRGVAALMRASLEGGRPRRQAYRRAGIACRRCGTLIRSRGQGDDNRTAYWCPGCQRDEGDAAARHVDSLDGGRAPHLHTSLRGFASALRPPRPGAGGAERSCRSRSRSIRPRAGRRSTSTGRSSRASSRSARDAARRCRTRRSRSTSSSASPPQRSSRARTQAEAGEEQALFRTVLLALVLDRRGLRRLRLGRRRRSTAPTPSSSARSSASDAPTRRSRRSSGCPSAAASSWRRAPRAPRGDRRAGEALARGAADCSRPTSAASSTGSACSSSSARWTPGERRRPTRPAELADAVTALRLATPGADRGRPRRSSSCSTAAVRRSGPCCRSPPPSRPASRPGSTRSAASVAADLRDRLAAADDDRRSAEALDRWELSLFQDEPFRSEQLRAALESLLGGDEGPWAAALRAAAPARERPRAEDQHVEPARARSTATAAAACRPRRFARARRDADARRTRGARRGRSTRRCSASARGQSASGRELSSRPDACRGDRSAQALPLARVRLRSGLLVPRSRIVLAASRPLLARYFGIRDKSSFFDGQSCVRDRATLDARLRRRVVTV